MRSSSLSLLLLSLPFSTFALPSPVGTVGSPEVLASAADAKSVLRPSGSTPAEIGSTDRLSAPPSPVKAAADDTRPEVKAGLTSAQVLQIEALDRHAKAFHDRQYDEAKTYVAKEKADVSRAVWKNTFDVVMGRPNRVEQIDADLEKRIWEFMSKQVEESNAYKADQHRQRIAIQAGKPPAQAEADVLRPGVKSALTEDQIYRLERLDQEDRAFHNGLYAKARKFGWKENAGIQWARSTDAFERAILRRPGRGEQSAAALHHRIMDFQRKQAEESNAYTAEQHRKRIGILAGADATGTAA